MILKITKLVGGIVIIGLSLCYLISNIRSGICVPEEVCIPAIIIITGFVLGFIFIIWALEGEQNE